MQALSDVRVAVLATDGFEESELTSPVRALREAGADVTIVSLRPGQIQGFKHDRSGAKVKVDCLIGGANPEDFDAVVLPGGTMNADAMRTVPDVQSFLQAMDEAGKPIAAICHGPWELVSADLVRDRTLTSYPTIQDDIRNAGGKWVDEECVVDGPIITSRCPDDLPAFTQAILRTVSGEGAKGSKGKPIAPAWLKETLE